MTDEQPQLKKIAQLSLAALGALLVLGIVFYKERLFFSDASYIPFNIVKNRSMAVQEHRYGSFITQMVPYFGYHLHLPAKLFLKCYTFSFNFFYLVAGFLMYRCRQYALVAVMACYYYLLVSDTFFWTNNEIHQAIAWMFIFFAVTLHMAQKKVKIYFLLPVFLLLAFLAIYTHFIVLIPLVFLWFFLWIQQDAWPWSRGESIFLTLCIAAIVGSKFLVVNDNSYDQSHLQNITHPSLNALYQAVVSPVIIKFFTGCITNYWCASLAFIAGVVSLFRSKKKWLALWCIASFIGYGVLMGITYMDLDKEVLLFHIESEWQSLGVIMAAPFIFSFLPKLKINQAIAVLSLIFVVRLSYICVASEKFSWRVHFTQSVLVEMRKRNITKLAFESNGDVEKKLLLSWGIPDESMLMSMMNGDDPQRTFVFVNTQDKDIMNKLTDPKIVYTSFEMSTPNSWNYEYNKPDTLHPYVVMKVEEMFKK